MFSEGDSVKANVEYLRTNSNYFKEEELIILENSIGTISWTYDDMYKVIFTESGIERINNLYYAEELLPAGNIIDF